MPSMSNSFRDLFHSDFHVSSHITLHRAQCPKRNEAEGLSVEMTSLFSHEGMSGPGDVTLRLPTSKTDQRGNGASRRLTCTCKLLVEAGDFLPEACPVCAVQRQVSRLHSLFGWAIDDDRTGKPLFPRADGSRASKVQLVQAWCMATAQSEKPSGHSPRRSGAKRYARQGWSVWMIQFMGRWAASTVLEYIEEAMAEVTACWAKRPAGCLTDNHEEFSAFRLTGSTGGSPKLRERVDRIEQIILYIFSHLHALILMSHRHWLKFGVQRTFHSIPSSCAHDVVVLTLCDSPLPLLAVPLLSYRLFHPLDHLHLPCGDKNPAHTCE